MSGGDAFMWFCVSLAWAAIVASISYAVVSRL